MKFNSVQFWWRSLRYISCHTIQSVNMKGIDIKNDIWTRKRKSPKLAEHFPTICIFSIWCLYWHYKSSLKNHSFKPFNLLIKTTQKNWDSISFWLLDVLNIMWGLHTKDLQMTQPEYSVEERYHHTKSRCQISKILPYIIPRSHQEVRQDHHCRVLRLCL